MKKIFVIQVEYPDNDVIPSEEIIEVTQECIEHYMELHFGANIMDGDYDRIKVREVTDFFSLVKRTREAQKKRDSLSSKITFLTEEDIRIRANSIRKTMGLESEVDEWLKKLK